jgi:hypothetical protein
MGISTRGAIVLALVAAVAGRAGAAATTPGEKCAVAKMKAAAKKTTARIACHTAAVTKHQPVDQACLMKAEARFVAAFVKAEARGGCITVDDSIRVENLTDQYVSSVYGALPGAPVKYIFVSSIALTGDLDGLNGADLTCANLAAASFVPGTYLAWLSDGTGSAAARLSHATVPYILLSGEKVADDYFDLTDGTLDHAIDRTEQNDLLTPHDVWTGTDPAGAAAGTNCGNWTSAANGDTGTVGATDSTNTVWTQGGTNPCDVPTRIYCVEQ